MTGEPPLTGHREAPPFQGFAPARPPSVSVLPGGAYDFYAPAVVGAPPPQAPPRPVTEEGESGLPVKLALGVTAVALLLSFAFGRLTGGLVNPSEQLDSQLRLGLVMVLFFYVLLGGALMWFCLQRRVALTWVRGHAVEAVLLGLPVGLLGGGLAVALNSGIAGHLSSDPNVELLVGGGGALRVSITLLVTAVLAPLVEETLFRGILAGTLLARGVAPAMWGSALAFAVWHMNPTSLRYYVFMGLLLGGIWRRRGLVASMSAHAAFNGVLTVAAVAATSGAGHFTQFGQVAFSLPGGWHQVTSAAPAGRMIVQGPAGAALLFRMEPNVGAPPDTQELLANLVAAETPAAGRRVVAGSEHTVLVGAGEAVVADVQMKGQPGHVLDFVVGASSYELVVVTGGSPAAERDWHRIVLTLTRTAG